MSSSLETARWVCPLPNRKLGLSSSLMVYSMRPLSINRAIIATPATDSVAPVSRIAFSMAMDWTWFSSTVERTYTWDMS